MLFVDDMIIYTENTIGSRDIYRAMRKFSKYLIMQDQLMKASVFFYTINSQLKCNRK